ncbi:unnamed protein product [Periconia digitata]|uniref:Uncharacterized protein n=1 Tax=Periconia digitata TaxID=1303443 RepID=A0A9W4XXF2_9PLEO|nr:unnamed protein product [Periconia digitata]
MLRTFIRYSNDVPTDLPKTLKCDNNASQGTLLPVQDSKYGVVCTRSIVLG